MPFHELETTGMTGDSAGETFEFTISGMDCNACVRKIETAVKAVPGVETIQISLADGGAYATIDPARATPDAIFAAIENAGYGVAR